MFATLLAVEFWELEQIRRSIAMLPPDFRSAGALTRDAAMAVVLEAIEARQDRDRYRQAVDRLRAVLEEFGL